MRSALVLSEMSEEQLQQQVWMKLPTAIARYENDLGCHYSQYYYLLEHVHRCMDNLHHFLIFTGKSSTREILEVNVALRQFFDESFILIPEYRVNPAAGVAFLKKLLDSNSPDEVKTSNIHFEHEGRNKILLLKSLVENILSALHSLHTTSMPLIARIGYFLETGNRLPTINGAKEQPLFEEKYTAQILEVIQKSPEPITGCQIQKKLQRRGMKVHNDAMTSSRKELNELNIVQDFGRKGLVVKPEYQLPSTRL